MRSVIASGFVLISLAFLMFPAPSVAAEASQCKGGSGWRGPDGFCISQAKLAEVCGTPAGAPCKQEAAPRVCFDKS